MKESTKKKWMPVGAFVAVFGSFATLMYLSITTFGSSNKWSDTSFFRFQQLESALNIDSSKNILQRSVDTPAVPASWSKTILRLGRDRRIGSAILTYRGKKGRSVFLLDVIIPDLDPQYTYKRQINIKEAREGFQVGEERFMLLSAGKSKMRLSHYTPAR